jgi:hypothetical protein
MMYGAMSKAASGGPGLSELERNWLDYARSVVEARPEHLEACAARHGRSDPADGSQTLRWPGYLGARFEHGRGLLLVGQVHRDINSSLERADPKVNQRYVAATTRWRSRESIDAEFLAETRRAYEYWFGVWVSPAWRTFRSILEAFGRSVEETAYANLAKCQLSTDHSPRKLIRLCQGEYPIGELITMLRPAAAFCAHLDASDQPLVNPRSRTVPVYAFNYRSGVNARGERKAEWIPNAVRDVLGT